MNCYKFCVLLPNTVLLLVAVDVEVSLFLHLLTGVFPRKCGWPGSSSGSSFFPVHHPTHQHPFKTFHVQGCHYHFFGVRQSSTINSLAQLSTNFRVYWCGRPRVETLKTPVCQHNKPPHYNSPLYPLPVNISGGRVHRAFCFPKSLPSRWFLIINQSAAERDQHKAH